MSNVATYLAKEALKDGNAVTIRAMRPDDKERLVKAFLHLQPQTIRTRFFYPKKTLSEDDLRWLDDISHGNHVGLVATVPSGGEELIIGEGSYAVLGPTAEIGFTVAEDWQGRGIASRLLQHLASIARDRAVAEFEAYVLQENEPMLAVFRRSGLSMTTRYAEGVLHVTLVLDSPAAPR
jgi:RimJ/RimL family protein N-acetyltransferase